jgi:hypothetical protein
MIGQLAGCESHAIAAFSGNRDGAGGATIAL